MKNHTTTKTIEIEVLSNGNLLLGNNYNIEFFVKTSDGIMVYSAEEMKEVYNYSVS